MKKGIFLLTFICFALFAFFSACVSQPAAPQATPAPEPAEEEKPVKTAPDWFFKTPEEDATYKYFVGSGMSKGGNLSEAENDATTDLISSIMLYIGVEVKSESEATGIGSIDDFSTEIKKVVSTKSEARVSGFEIMEMLSHETSDGLIVYVLCRYNKKDLEKEKQKIEREIREKYEAISGPEQEGQELVSRGEYYSAAIKFVQAADAAANENVSNAKVKFERNIKQAMDAIDKINLIPLNNKLEGLVGQSLPETFDLKVVTGGSADDPGVPDVNIRISYKEFNAGKTRLRVKSVSRKTEENGLLSFDHPVPDFTGSEKVTMALDFDEYIELLDDIPGKWYDAVDALDELIVSKKASFEFTVISNAKNIETGIVIIDLDQTNSPIPGSKTGPTVMSYLSSQQYKMKNLNVKPADILDKSDFEIIPMLSANFGDKVQRAMFGTARILEVKEDDGKIFVKTTATVQVVDLATEEILLSVVKTVNGFGNNEENATVDSFKRLGQEVGNDILNNLR